MVNKKEKCDGCQKKFSRKALKRKNGKEYCNHCYLKKSKCVMLIVNENIPKSYLPTKLKEKKNKPKIKDALPKIRGVKKIVVSRQLHLYLTGEEKDVLYKKFISNGMSNHESSDRVTFISEKMKELAKKIKVEAGEKKLTSEQMNKKFLEGLAKYSEVEE